MGALASSLHYATVASALGWPLAAGIAVVAWSKARSAAHARRMAAMETQLKGFYRAVEASRAPAQLTMIVDALAEGEELAASTTDKVATTARP